MVDDNNAALARAIRRSEPQGAIHRDCDDHLAAIIRKMLAPQPSHRYQTADEVAADLPLSRRRALLSPPPRARAPAPPHRSFPRRRRASSGRSIPCRPIHCRRSCCRLPRRRNRPVLHLGTALLHAAPPAEALRAVAAVIVMMIILAQGAAWVRTERLRDRLGPRRGHRHRAAAHGHPAHPSERAVSLGVVGAVAASGDRSDAPHCRPANPRLPSGPLRLAAAVAGGTALAGAGRRVRRRASRISPRRRRWWTAT